ncbi:tetratricopeptide repeat protein [Shewanella woodyi]|uniref:tetratricopeptide repeat protein n=1 Tax=Shewanella woodyi TaxID=60961 RepID=UPI0007F93505|nr:tetratricopeptide repeat protein [Shewanella woodyi]
MKAHIRNHAVALFNPRWNIGIVLFISALITGCATTTDTQYTLTDKLNLANQAYHEARLSDAETLYLAISISNPDYKESWFKLGNIYARQGRLIAAIESFERVLSLDQQDGRAWYNLAIVKLNQSRKVLQQAEQRLPTNSAQLPQIKTLKLRLNDVSRGI